jgi:23S rRNA (cytosine1962-C5)-methyltransferase
MVQIILKKGRDEAVKRYHPWVFSGAIQQTIGTPEEGDLVELLDIKRNVLGIGYWANGSIAVRILTFKQEEINQAFWNERITNAYNFRKTLGLVETHETNCFRLIHAEGDLVPGLIIDIYGDTAVVQCHSKGIHLQKELITHALKNTLGDNLKAVYDKSAETLHGITGITNGYLYGTSTVPKQVTEHGHKFWIDWETGQKTGFFLDQRENRALLGHYVKDKTVLNAFCYTGGFSVYALAAGAKQVDSVDISQKAIDLTDKNVGLNGNVENHKAWAEDVLPFLKQNQLKYDVMVVDPPAFAKSMSKRHNAVQAYKRLNTMALEQIVSGGILFTFSCSQVVDRELFYDTIVSAAIEAKRKVRVLHFLTQPPDHPISIFHPEGSYLKGLVLQVE